MNSDHTLSYGDDFIDSMYPDSEEFSDADRSAIADLPSGSALLLVVRGSNKGERFLLNTDKTRVGRDSEAEIFLDDVTVSRNHAEFIRHSTAFEIRDCESLNGTFFDGVRVEQALLHNGAEIQIGKFRFKFFASPLDISEAAGA